MSIDVYPPKGMLVPGTELVTVSLIPTWRNQTTGLPIDGYWRPTQVTSCDAWWTIPTQYAGGNITYSVVRAGGATGTATMVYQVYRNRDGAAQTQITADTAITFTPGDTNDHVTTLTQVAGAIQAGDNLRLIINRDGDNAADTMASSVYFGGLMLTYLATTPRVFNAQPYEEGSFTVTATGFSGTAPSGTARYIKIGKLVTIMFPDLQGTSNATTLTLTGLPASIQPRMYTGVFTQGQDNSVYLTIPSFIAFAGASTNITAYKDATGAAWTASNQKLVASFSIAYLTA